MTTSYHTKKDAYGGEIRYQLRIQRYIEWGVNLTRKLSKVRCKVGFVLRTSIITLKEKCQQLSAILRHLSSLLKMLLVLHSTLECMRRRFTIYFLFIDIHNYLWISIN